MTINIFSFKKITFSNVQKIQADKISDVKKQMAKAKCDNGLYKMLLFGYSHHIPITIRPDDILNNVVSIWSKYVILNAEKFRSMFVSHQGQKKLTYLSGGTYCESRMGEFTSGLINLMIKDQGNGKVLWAHNCNFSTTDYIDKMIRVFATLASQKKYYTYGINLACGFPEITLSGTKEDWDNLINSIKLMPDLDDRIISWKNSLIETVCNMIGGSEDFWQSCLTKTRYGSGGQMSETGWALVFNPINEKGEWLDNVRNNDYLNLENEILINVNDNGDEFDVKILSGPTNIGFNDSGLAVSNKNLYFKQIKIV